MDEDGELFEDQLFNDESSELAELRDELRKADEHLNAIRKLKHETINN